jgi:4-carboxymuconolactone decarboxylase
MALCHMRRAASANLRLSAARFCDLCCAFHQRGMSMDKARFDKGLEVRTAVLGKDYVEASMKNADDFNRPFQELVTEYCWGAAWGSDKLSRKTRSILNRQHELKLHIKGALNNGVTKEEIREVLIQVAIYAGIPCGVDSFRIAREAFKEVEAKG